MLMFNDIIPIVEKYWKNYDNYVDDLKQACSAFGIVLLNHFKRNSNTKIKIIYK